MTQKLALRGRPSATQLLARVLETPDLATQVRALPAPVLGRLIERVGLEDAGELVAFATTEQLAAVFDEDLWRSDRPGEDERFDADRFLVWLEVMLEAGDRFVADKLFELPTELVTLAFHKHLLVLDMDALTTEMEGGGDDVDQIEKALSDCLCEELEQFRLIARTHEGWDNLLTAILALDRDHHDYLTQILERCAAMDAEYIEDNGGLYEVLTSEEMLEADVAADREDRRAEAGHVAPSSAAAFLKLARRRADDLAERDPLTRAYFRSLAKSPPAAPSPAPTRATNGSHDLAALLHEVEAEVVARDLPQLPAGVGRRGDAAPEPLLARALRELAETEPEVFAERSEELAYVANVLSSGCSVRGRKLRPVEAVQAALATCSLGLELAMRREAATDPARVLAARPADGLFRLAWHRLDEDVVQAASKAALSWLERQAKGADDARALRRAALRLGAMVDKGTPWLAAEEVEAASAVLDPAAAATIRACIDECPTRPGSEAGSLEFIASLDDLAAIGAALDALTSSVPARARPRPRAPSQRTRSARAR